ncbi:hypothetical protein CDL15_Pgr011457 [Punica granatum]|uniref:Uncharacterized protein n=1 Tax=Punica granatum TaxID=22663 RepID=A0A218WFS7_PUNGR|nr:hypothetical protein CDL15_Pgr011457 [Punica granatum]
MADSRKNHASSLSYYSRNLFVTLPCDWKHSDRLVCTTNGAIEAKQRFSTPTKASNYIPKQKSKQRGMEVSEQRMRTYRDSAEISEVEERGG